MKLLTDDKNAGLEAPDGHRWRPDADGVIHVDDETYESYAAMAARETPLFRRYVKGFPGVDMRALEARHAAWKATHPDR